MSRDSGTRTAGPAGVDDALSAAAILQRLLPPEVASLFDAAYLRMHLLYDEFIYRLVLRTAAETGLDAATREPGTVEEIAVRAGFEAPHALVPLDWMLRLLAARGLVEETPGGGASRYRSLRVFPSLDPAPVSEEQKRLDVSWIPAYTLAETVARDYPAFLRGRVTGEEVLFSPRRLRLWTDYFSNDNGLYVVNNRLGALAVEQWLPRPGGTILELGGGLGSGALALLERLEAAGRLGEIAEYRFSEFVPAFLRRGEQALRARRPDVSRATFGPLDMNRAFGDQGVLPGSVSVVYAVNTLHVARDLDFTLGEILRVLEPGGRLILSECVRSHARQPIESEFVFNLTETFRSPQLHPRYRPSGGFLTPGQWKDAMEAAGFVDIRFLPDIVKVHDQAPRFIAAAIGASRSG